LESSQPTIFIFQMQLLQNLDWLYSVVGFSVVERLGMENRKGIADWGKP
jgi:hypothetical protein